MVQFSALACCLGLAGHARHMRVHSTGRRRLALGSATGRRRSTPTLPGGRSARPAGLLPTGVKKLHNGMCSWSLQLLRFFLSFFTFFSLIKSSLAFGWLVDYKLGFARMDGWNGQIRVGR
jgi:hypothetical protein